MKQNDVIVQIAGSEGIGSRYHSRDEVMMSFHSKDERLK